MRLHLRAPSHTTFVPLPTFMYRYSPQPRLVNRKSKSAAAVPTRGSSMRCKIVWSCAHVRCGIFVYCILFFFVSIFSVVASSNFSPQLLFSLGWALGLTRLSEVKGIYGNDALEAADAEDKQWNQTEISEGLLLSLWFPRCHFLILFPAERGVTDVHPRLVIKQKCQPKISIIKTLTARSRGCFQH